MIWTLRVTLQQYEDEWTADIEIDSTATLEELHYAIQNAVAFGNDHLYAFYLARNAKSRDREFFDDDDGRVYSTTLDELFPLQAKKSLFYLFDFGDHWLFKVSRTRKRPFEPERSGGYPRVVAEVGKKPVQYPPYDS